MSSLLSLNFDVLSSILQQCALPSLHKLRLCCSGTNDLVEDELRRRYRSMLLPFIQNHGQFRDELQNTGSVLAGERTLLFAFGISPVNTPLEIYTPRSNAFHVLGFLTVVEHYSITNYRASPSQPHLVGEHCITELQRNGRSIHVIQSIRDTPYSPIPSLWCTALMTCVGGYHYHVPYPSLMEQEKVLLTPTAINQADDVVWLQPLLLRFFGYGLCITLDPVDLPAQRTSTLPCRRERSPTCPLTIRWTGDPFSLTGTMSYERSLARRIQLRDFVHTHGWCIVWWRGGSPCGGRCETGQRYIIPRSICTLAQHVM
ncbi:hypothetical protein FKP32DRAFT_1577010 [Trametes sanguinea]|nr:hypothetical protein FKP32DRAFT_1577010 [Trametes sanguinea]